MRLKVQEVGGSLHPNEVVVQVNTATGVENLVVDRRSLAASSLAVGSPISQDENLWLVELPRETTSGAWRVWVSKDSLEPEKNRVHAA